MIKLFDMKFISALLVFCTFSSILFGQGARTITVRGTSVKELDPESIILTITYKYRGRVGEIDAVKEQDKRLQETMEQFKIPKNNLLLDNEWATGDNGFASKFNTTMSISKSYRLTITNLEILDGLLLKLVEMGAENIAVATLESSKIDSIKKVALQLALENAREKARGIAAQMGVKLENPLIITEIFPDKTYQASEQDEYQNKGSRAEARANATLQYADVQVLNMRKIRVSSTCEIVYEIK